MDAKVPLTIGALVAIATLIAAIAIMYIVAYARRAPRVTLVTDPEIMRRITARYYGGFTQADAHARGCKSGAHCQDGYVRAVVTAPSGQQRRALREAVAQADRALRSHPQYRRAFHALFRNIPWKVCIVRDVAEGGFPHTHADIIVIPEHMLTGSALKRDLPKILVHELVHVAQRARSSVFEHAYTRFWGVHKVGAPRTVLPPNLADLRRSNPDLDDSIWMHRDGGAGCIMLYTDAEPEHLLASETRVLNLDDAETGRQWHCNYEHPNEAMAYILAEIAFLSSGSVNAADRVHKDDGSGKIHKQMFPPSGVHAWLAWVQQDKSYKMNDKQKLKQP